MKTSRFSHFPYKVTPKLPLRGIFDLIQLVFYISNAVLIFLIFKKNLRPGLSFFLALLFLVHPINEETVVYISNLQDVLFTFFGLLSFYILQRDSKKPRNIIIANVLLLFSIFSKETGLLFLVLDAIYVYLVKKNRSIFSTKFYVFTTIFTGGIYFLLRLAVPINAAKTPLVPIMSLNFWERIINVPAIIFYYIRVLLFPWSLVSTNSWIIQNANFSNFYLPLFLDSVLFIILFSICFYLYKRKEVLGIFFLFWFIIGLAVHIQIIPLDATVADRWFYFPFIGLLGLIGLFFQTVLIKKLTVNICIAIVIILLPILMLRTIIRNIDWQNQSTLLSHDIKLSKNDYQVEILYANDLLDNHKYDEAYPHIQKAISLFPQSYSAYNSLGIYYANKGEISNAKKAYEKSIANGKNVVVYQNLGLLLLHKDRSALTRDFLRQATLEYPNSEKLWYYRLLIEYTLGNYDDALLASRNFYLLRRDNESYTIYNKLFQKLPLNIQW